MDITPSSTATCRGSTTGNCTCRPAITTWFTGERRNTTNPSTTRRRSARPVWWRSGPLKLYFSLRSIGDGIYSPVYDLVHAVKSAHIGTDALQTSLTRVGAGLKVVVKQTDGSAFIPEIASVKVNIGNIAEKLNFYTGDAENMTKTVQFELSRSVDGLSYGNITVMLFPSAAKPPLELIITLQDGTEYKLNKNLSATLSPNTRLTLNINVGKILAEGNPGISSTTIGTKRARPSTSPSWIENPSVDCKGAV